MHAHLYRRKKKLMVQVYSTCLPGLYIAPSDTMTTQQLYTIVFTALAVVVVLALLLAAAVVVNIVMGVKLRKMKSPGECILLIRTLTSVLVY